VANRTAATGLYLYDTACRALAEAKLIDEVKGVADKAMAMQLYARQARDKSLMADAAEIRERAEYRLAEMLAGQREAGLLNPGTRLMGGGNGAGGSVTNPPADLPTLEQGINKRLADKARKVFALPQDIYEAALSEYLRKILANSRIEPLLTIAKRLQAQVAASSATAVAAGSSPAGLGKRGPATAAGSRFKKRI